MIIVFTVSTYYPRCDGVQNITEYYTERLAREGHEVIVITSWYDGLSERELHNGVRIIRVKIFTERSIYKGNINKYREYIKSIGFEIDILVNVCLQTALTDCILDIIPTLKCKKILYLHGMAHFKFPSIPKTDIYDVFSWFLNICRWYPFYIRAINKIAAFDYIIHLHRKDQTYIRCKNSGYKNNLVFENGSNISAVEDCVTARSNYYICVSSYIHDKNQELVLDAYYQSNTRKRLIFIGIKKTPYYYRLKKLDREKRKKYYNKEKRVEFLVDISRKVTERYIKNAFAVLSGSKSEKYPVTICEAIACELPYITTDVGIVKYLPGGMIIHNTKEMAEKMNYIESLVYNRRKNAMLEREYHQQNQNFENNYALLSDIIGNSNN